MLHESTPKLYNAPVDYFIVFKKFALNSLPSRLFFSPRPLSTHKINLHITAKLSGYPGQYRDAFLSFRRLYRAFPRFSDVKNTPRVNRPGECDVGEDVIPFLNVGRKR